MRIAIIIFCNWFIQLSFGNILQDTRKLQVQNYSQARETAIRDFCKTKLFKQDSIFYVSIYDTLRETEVKKLDQNNYKTVAGPVHPDIIAVAISAYKTKFFLDTTIEIRTQTAIPSRCVELNCKLFYWDDIHYELTTGTIKILNKYHLIQCGGPSAAKRFEPNYSGSRLSTAYYFCRNNLATFKKITSTTAVGFYAPPNIKCE